MRHHPVKSTDQLAQRLSLILASIVAVAISSTSTINILITMNIQRVSLRLIAVRQSSRQARWCIDIRSVSSVLTLKHVAGRKLVRRASFCTVDLPSDTAVLLPAGSSSCFLQSSCMGSYSALNTLTCYQLTLTA